MEELKNAVIAVCAASGAICAVDSLAAGTRLRSQMKLLLSMVLMLVAVTPFIRGGFDLELPDMSVYSSDFAYTAEIYSAELARQTAENIAEVLRSQIAAAGIECGDIEVEVNISDDMSISISRVTVSAADFEGASAVIRSSLGSDTEVYNGYP